MNKLSISSELSLTDQLVKILKQQFRYSQPGTRLPSERSLAEQYGVSRKVTRAAVMRLTEQGFLERRVGKGTFVAGQENQESNLPISIWSISSAAPKAFLEGFIKQFNQDEELLHEDCFHGQYVSALEIMVNSLKKLPIPGKRVDLIEVDDNSLPYLAAEGFISPLDDMFEQSSVFNTDLFVPKMLETFRYEDKLYGIPMSFTLPVLFYNKTLFDQKQLAHPDSAWTWNDMLNAALKLTTITDQTTANKTYGLAFSPFHTNTILPFIYQNNGRIVDDTGKCTINTPEVIEALTFILDLLYKYQVMPIAQSHDSNIMMELFCNGRIGMFIGLYRHYPSIKDGCMDDWGVSIIPARKRHGASRPVQGWALAANSPTPEKSFTILEQLITYYQQPQMAQQLYCIPAFKKTAIDIPDIFYKTLEFSETSFSYNPKLAKPFITQLVMLMNNFQTPAEFCQVMEALFSENTIINK